MPKSIITLRSTENPALPGEVLEFDHVGAIHGGPNNTLLTIFNEDPVLVSGEGEVVPGSGPKPFYAIAADRVYSVETPEFKRAPKQPEQPVNLIVPRHMAGARPS